MERLLWCFKDTLIQYTQQAYEVGVPAQGPVASDRISIQT